MRASGRFGGAWFCAVFAAAVAGDKLDRSRRLADGLGCDVSKECTKGEGGAPCGCSALGCGCGHGYACHGDGFCYGCRSSVWGEDCRLRPAGCGCADGLVCHSGTGACSAAQSDAECVGLWCNNHGSGGFFADAKQCVCRCDAGWTGPECDRRAEGRGCPDEICNRHGVPTAACTCECLPGFAGTRCEKCAPGHEDYPYCKSALTRNDTVAACACREGWAWCGGDGNASHAAGCYETRIVDSTFLPSGKATCFTYLGTVPDKCAYLRQQYAGAPETHRSNAVVVAFIIVACLLTVMAVVLAVCLKVITGRRGGPVTPPRERDYKPDPETVVVSDERGGPVGLESVTEPAVPDTRFQARPPPPPPGVQFSPLRAPPPPPPVSPHALAT